MLSKFVTHYGVYNRFGNWIGSVSANSPEDAVVKAKTKGHVAPVVYPSFQKAEQEEQYLAAIHRKLNSKDNIPVEA